MTGQELLNILNELDEEVLQVPVTDDLGSEIGEVLIAFNREGEYARIELRSV